ncbi:FAD-binding oxidoreductase [Chondromyces crocatus]|uniref:Alkyl-dihydroxyacetonephosphate synthase n=1 Tax=Chondromyces crocatus TaxID=52 RepID=A0A0K1ET40_CHOCO|nr:FAD-binding oxidoreductase [Chondromyces crocatus]AKT44031.1 alkyl-dihydroxyacetonephosphate synthase [Chondromyces crocatus]
MDVEAILARALPHVPRSASPVDRIAYARDLWPRHHLAVREGQLPKSRPGVIVWPSSTEEVADVVRLCASEGLPLVPFGAGSGVCGGILPDARTVVLDLKRLCRQRKLHRDEPSVEIEAGATGIRFEESLNGEGFTLGHFPSSILCSTVGGWVAARGAGQCSGLYGKIEDMVASLEVINGRGEIARLSRRTHGPDITPLFIGSEGVLGVITAATLRLHPAPPARAFGTFSFPTLEAGWTAMQAMFQDGLRPAVSRLYDPFDSFIARMGARRRRGAEHSAEPEDAERPPSTLFSDRKPAGVSKSSSSSPGAGARVLRLLLRAPGAVNQVVDALGDRVLRGSTLVLIFEGRARDAHDDLARGAHIAERHGGKPLGEEPARHWLAHRYSVSYRQAPVFMAGAFSDTFEVAAPWSRLGALHQAVRSALGRHVFVMAHLSHAYPDGCSIYFTFAGSAPTQAEAEARYDAAWRDGLDAAISAGGTISHHHGVGRSKAPRLGAELGLGVDVIRALRDSLDPAGVMNPGNLLPRAGDPRSTPRVSPSPASPLVDRASLLVRAAGSSTLADIEQMLAQEGLSLGLGPEAPPFDTSVASWIASGGRGAPDPWLDPVDHLVAGFTARLASGAELEVRPAPRRAVGPDLFSLFLGMEERVGTLSSVWLRVRGSGQSRPLPTSLVRQPEIQGPEAAWIDEVARVAAAVD